MGKGQIMMTTSMHKELVNYMLYCYKQVKNCGNFSHYT